MLSSHVEICQVPRRLALALTCLVFGVFLSEAVFRPLAHRIGRMYAGPPYPDPSSTVRKLSLGALAFGVVLLSLFVFLGSDAAREPRPSAAQSGCSAAIATAP